MRPILAAIAALFVHASLTATPISGAITPPTVTREDPVEPPPPAESQPEAPPQQLLRHPLSLMKHRSRSLMVCEDHEATRCFSAKMPSEVGNVIKVVHSHFVSQEIAWASWMALTAHRASVCYLALADRTVHCVPVGATVPQGVDIAFLKSKDEVPLLTFSRQPGVDSSDELNRKIRTFARGVLEAGAALQRNAYDTIDPLTGRPKAAPLLVEIDDGGHDEGGAVDWEDTSWWDTVEGESYYGDEPPTIDANDGWGWDATPTHDDVADTFFPPLDYVFEQPVPIETERLSLDPVTVKPACVYGVVIACIVPLPPRVDPNRIPPVTEPVKPPKLTWSPCKAFGIFCSAYDEQGDVLKYPPDEHSPMDRWEQYCSAQLEIDLDTCRAYPFDARSRRVCRDNAYDRERACLKTAQEITGNR